MRRISQVIQYCKFSGSLTLLVFILAGSELRAADNLQTFVNRLMQGKAGAVIVSDPRTGQILALWNPEIAFKEAYTPGSTAKLIVSAAALEEGIISPSDKIMCRRVPRLLGESSHCSHPPAAFPFDLAGALANSCNYFFSELSPRLSSSALAHWYGVFGFGAAGEAGSPGEVLIPDKPPGRALAALGQQGVTATPAQVLLAYSAVAMHGPVFALTMPGQRKAPSIDRVVALREGTFAVLTEGLRDCVVKGSCRALVLSVTAGSSWNIDANRFRYAVDRRLGWQQIKSNLYTIRRQGDSWLLSGHGLGHGVGLCQAGAEQMARLGSSTEHILSVYFPGTEISRQPADDSDPIASSEHFDLIYRSSQEPWVKQTLDTLEQWRKELGTHAEILPPRVRVQTWAAVGGFIRATGQPGWMAASSDGQSISLQPLELLARKHILDQTLRHELTHLVVHRVRAKVVPRWFEEGCVLYFTGERIEALPTSFKTVRQLEDAITRPRSEADMRSAYAQALDRVRQLTHREGEAALWRMLAHPSGDDLRLFQ